MPSGWTRKILEDFEFDFEVVYAEEIAAGDLRARFDVLILEDGAVPPPSGGGGSGSPADPARVPSEYRDRIGSITAARGVPEILDFARARLARYKVPRSIDFEDELPRNESGKLYIRRLKDRYWQGRERRI